MYEIRLYNDRTGEILIKSFTDEESAEEYEFPLIHIGAHYAWYQDGELIYEQEGYSCSLYGGF